MAEVKEPQEVKEPRDTSRCEFDSEGFCGPPKKTKDKMPDAEMRKLETAPFDPRFPNQNQTRYCYQSFVDFHRCHKLKGEDYQPCDYFKRVYQSMCPAAWVEKWDTQVEEGRFPGRI